MKIENYSDPLVYWFHHKTHISQIRGFSWWNHTTFSVQNATTIIHFIVTAKIPMGIRSISAEPANINLHPNAQEHGKSIVGSIRLVPCAERPFCITITNTIPTTAAAIRSAIIPFSSGNRPLRSFPTVIRPTIFRSSLFFTAPGTYAFKALRTMFPTIWSNALTNSSRLVQNQAGLFFLWER